MHVFFLGASANIGYFTARRLLEKGATATFLLRKPAAFDEDAKMQSYIKNGRARIAKGDALKVEDVRNAWRAALEFGQGKVDVVIFTLGGKPKLTLTGLGLDPARDICTRSFINLLSTIPDALRVPENQPRLIVMTSMGITSAAYAGLPLLLKPVYGWLLTTPASDKLGVERLIAHCAGWQWSSKDKVRKDVLPDGWQATPGLMPKGTLKHVVIVRPPILTDGNCRGDEGKAGKAPYRTKMNEAIGDSYTISRKDVAHFIAEGLLADWSKWENSGVSIGY